MACAACILVFVGLANEPNERAWEALSKWGAYPPGKIRDGAYWALLTSVFVHLELWHLAFNVYWLYVLGSELERAIGSVRWLLFFIGAAVVSSGAELGFAGTTGIGASGVGYAIFGFMWITRKQFPTFAKVLTQSTIAMFFLWLVGCLVMTLSDAWHVGNAAHFSGLIFGVTVGAFWLYPARKHLLAGAVSLLIMAAIVPLFWAPWSSDWTVWRAIRAHRHGDFRSAVAWYKRGLKLGYNPIWCYKNMARAYFSLGDKPRFEETMATLRKLDQKAAWALEAETSGDEQNTRSR
jgi:GlpG protein